MTLKLELKYLLSVAFTLPVMLLADQTLLGTVIVDADLLVNGVVEVGEASIGGDLYPAYTLAANSAVGVTIVDQIATGNGTTWNWVKSSGSTEQVVMKLEDTGKLSLYNANSSTPKVIIDGEGILYNGSRWINYNGTRNSLALGNFTTASGYYSSALGRSATAAGSYSAALGYAARASSTSSTAIGSNAYAYGEWTTASGASASASANYATSLGTSATASGVYATALGSFSRASDNSSVALGNSSNASGYYGTALGGYSSASGLGLS